MTALCDGLELRLGGDVAQIVLTRAAKRNALTPHMVDALATACETIERDRDVRVAILSSADPRAFCVGADIVAWSALEPLDMWRSWTRLGHQAFDRLARLRQPLIAVVAGHALGGGTELAACADLRVAEPSAVFALPETGIGTVPGWSGTQRLTRRIGAQSVRRMALAGERLSASEAHAAGLVDRLAAEGEGMMIAQEIANTIAGRAPVATQLVKQLINAAEGEDAAPMEQIAGALAASTEDGREGVASFREKRAPNFEGR